LYVTGYILNLILAELSIQPLNSSITILKQKGTIVTDDAWRIAVDNEEALSTIKADFFLIESQKK